MTKKDLVKKLTEEQGIAKEQANAIVEAIFGTIVDELKAGETVKIPGFGSFVVKTRKQRVSVIPNSNKRVIIPEYRVAGFKPAKNFKDQVK